MLLCVTATSVVAAVACHDNRLGEPAEVGKVAPASDADDDIAIGKHALTQDADTRIGRIAADAPAAAPAAT